jgi:hypothetical protein
MTQNVPTALGVAVRDLLDVCDQLLTPDGVRRLPANRGGVYIDRCRIEQLRRVYNEVYQPLELVG